MQPPPFLNDPERILVADASAVISITASARAALIVSAVPNRIIVPDVVVAELESGSRKGRTNAEQLHELINDKLVEMITIGNAAAAHFEELVIGPARSTLDDGEAATIACALEIGGVPLIDERKARRICDARHPSLRYGCTVDIFAHREVGKALGDADLALAVLNALKEARMRVLPHHLDWVVNLVGPENAAECNSLPRAARLKAELAQLSGRDR
jgi:predicted nucleic acid-binding protein